MNVFDTEAVSALGIQEGEVVISIHYGSRGLGHQIDTEFFKDMAIAAADSGIDLPDRELACAPSTRRSASDTWEPCAQPSTARWPTGRFSRTLLRHAIGEVFPDAELSLIYDVSHSTCKVEEHLVNDRSMRLYVHRKGATRAFGPASTLLTLGEVNVTGLATSAGVDAAPLEHAVEYARASLDRLRALSLPPLSDSHTWLRTKRAMMVRAYLVLAQVAIRQGQWVTAENELQTAIDLIPSRKAYLLLSRVYGQTNRQEQAIAATKKADALTPAALTGKGESR